MKYHLGMSRQRINHATEKEITISIVANPSHLEGKIIPYKYDLISVLQHVIQWYRGKPVQNSITVMTIVEIM